MIKRIDKIIQSKTAPENNNVLWDDGKNLKINRNGEWESVGKSDWNAQKDEAGYIENKPFGSFDYYSFEDSDSVVINENQIIINCPYFNAIKLNESDNMYGGDENGLIIFGNRDYYTGDFDYDTQVFFSITYDSKTETLTIDCDENISQYLKYIKPVYFNYIYSIYIDDGVIKTTPQTLPTVDKNQALANLGIDPVAYDLLLHPYDLLSFDEVSGELKPIPDYLLTSDRRNLKYQNPCFYTGLTNGVLTYNYDENAFAEGAGLVFTTYRDCTIGEYELAEYTSYRIVVDSNGIIEFSE